MSELRSKIEELTSEMLDNPNEHGIYATTKFYERLEKYILQREERIKLKSYADGLKAKFRRIEL